MLSFAEIFRFPVVIERDFFDFAESGILRQVSKGTLVTSTNDPSGGILILLDGTLRIEHHCLNGRGHLPYLLQGNADGVLLTKCPDRHQAETVRAVAETDLELLSLSQHEFDYLMATSNQFRGLIFQANSKRMLKLMHNAENSAVA